MSSFTAPILRALPRPESHVRRESLVRQTPHTASSAARLLPVAGRPATSASPCPPRPYRRQACLACRRQACLALLPQPVLAPRGHIPHKLDVAEAPRAGPGDGARGGVVAAEQGQVRVRDRPLPQAPPQRLPPAGG